MRSGELCELEIDNIDFERKQITLTAEKTKASRSRIIPMPSKVKEVLKQLVEKALHEKHKHLICTSSGKKQTPEYLAKRMRNLLKNIEGINDPDEVSIRTLCKTYISHMIMQGTDPIKVMDIVGRYLALFPNYVNSDREILPF